mgnify:CR=1 FL=1
MMLNAEFAELKGKAVKAENQFECAILRAHSRGQTGDAAKCEQRYGEFLLRQKRGKEAALHIQRAAKMFDEWGALAVGDQLRDRYPEMMCPLPSVELVTKRRVGRKNALRGKQQEPRKAHTTA